MENVEKICELFKVVQLEESVKCLRAEGKTAFLRIMREVDQKIEAERRAALTHDAKNTLDKQVRDVNILITIYVYDLLVLIKIM